MFDVTIEAARRLVSTRLAGYMSLDDAAAFIAALRQRFAAAGFDRDYLLMVDTTEAMPQSQDVVAAFQRHIATLPKAKRIAVINGSPLARMQIRRIMTQPYMRIVGTRAEALAWLIDAAEPATEPRAA